MGLLDAYDQFSETKCKELTRQSSVFEKVTETFGLTNLVSGVQSFVENGIVNSLLESPLRQLGEDLLAQTIQENARRLSQNILNQVPEKLTKTLTDVRAVAFNTVFTTLTFKNDMVLYFASVTAQECVDAIREKRNTLISLQESIRELHNALLVLAGGGKFFRSYLANLRKALILIYEAEQDVFKVQAAFFSVSAFPQGFYNSAKNKLEQAHALIMPPLTGADAEELQQGFLKNVFVSPDPSQALAMVMIIPKLTKDMLEQYDLYALKVLKVNALLLGFQSIVQNLEKVTGGEFKDLVIEQLKSTRTYLNDLVDDMSIQLNGVKGDLRNVNNYNPNPTKTSAKAVSWGVRVKAAQVMLEMIDPQALQTLSISNAGLDAYYRALDTIAQLNDRVSSTAVLKATAGRETPGTIEADFITFAFQANQAIVDSNLLETENGQDKEIEAALLRYIKTVEPLLDSIKALGDSVYRLLGDLGMDRASDALKRGAFGEFFSMDGKTASYVGAAIAGLSAIQSLLSSTSQRSCVEQTITRLKVAETSKKLVAQRTVQQNATKLQRTSQGECEKEKRQKRKIEGCTSGLDLADLRDNPLRSLGGLFGGIFGGDVADSLGGTFGKFGDALSSKGNLGVANLGIGKTGTTVASNLNAATKSASNALGSAAKSLDSAKKEMSEAINKVPGMSSSPNDSLDSLQKKIGPAKKKLDKLKSAGDKAASGDIAGALEDAGVSGKIAGIDIKEAQNKVNKAKKVKSVFDKSKNTKDLLKGLSKLR
jgi:hypothetical protein